MMDVNTGKTLSKNKHIRQSVFDILQTPKGERVLNRNYGSNICDLLDKPITSVACNLAAEITDSLAVFEKRIKVLEVECTANEQGKVGVTIILDNNNSITGVL